MLIHAFSVAGLLRKWESFGQADFRNTSLHAGWAYIYLKMEFQNIDKRTEIYGIKMGIFRNDDLGF